MAFIRYAKAGVVKSVVSPKTWSQVRVAAKDANLTPNLIEQASEIIGDTFNPDKYLLTHATIVASVDTYEVPNTKLGSQTEDGFRINRKYGDYRVAPECDAYINNNLDCWSRDVLLKSYRTFIGSHNFVEHVQVEDLSKGRIIDAVARDIGPSVYIDILVATDKRNKELIKAIESGKMATMSMGCTVDFTVCTKCGHVAADETEMCQHVKYQKGNAFYDDQGRKHRVAELCGHPDVDPHGGVNFIEASWVETPAFAGAVMRNIIEPKNLSITELKKAKHILDSLPKEWDATSLQKAATGATLAEWGEDESAGDDAEDGGAEADPFTSLEGDVQQLILDRVKKKIREQLDQDDVKQELSPEDSTSAPNDTVIKEGRRRAANFGYRAGLRALVKTSNSNVELIERVAAYNTSLGLTLDVALYRAILETGPISKYANNNKFLRACRLVLDRTPTKSESNTLIRLGRLLSEMTLTGGESPKTKER